jgi:hypothetical protein
MDQAGAATRFIIQGNQWEVSVTVFLKLKSLQAHHVSPKISSEDVLGACNQFPFRNFG